MENFRFEQERSSEFKQKKQELVEYILEQQYGSIISYGSISKILEVNIELDEEIQRTRNIVGSLKPFLMNKGRVLKSIKDVGFYILKPKEMSSHCYRTYVKGSMRMIDKSMYVLDCTEKYDLSDDRKKEIEDMMKLNKELSDKMWATVKQSSYYDRMSYYNSLED